MSSDSLLDDRDGVLEVVADDLGMRLISARLIRREPGASGFTTGHDVVFAGPDAREHHHTVFIEARATPRESAGVLRVLALDGSELAVWLHPHDPELPALAAAVMPDAAAVLMQRLGFDPTGLSVSLLAYRAGKRAVVRMDMASGTVFLKVVRPAAAGPLRARHEAWRAAGIPVPQSLAWADDGLLALAPLSGVEAVRAAIGDHKSFADELDELMSRVHSMPSDGPARASLALRVDWYADRVCALAPDHADRVTAFVRVIRVMLDDAPPWPHVTTIHGDLHLAQVFVDPHASHAIVGLLDIDTAGVGDPADDAAALWAHLTVSAHRALTLEPERADQLARLADHLRNRWPRVDDAGFVRRAAAIAATHLLGHSLSGSLDATTALDLAETLLFGK